MKKVLWDCNNALYIWRQRDIEVRVLMRIRVDLSAAAIVIGDIDVLINKYISWLNDL